MAMAKVSWGSGAARVAPIAAAALLLTASFAARGDELSDLRASNQLLQQRLDQLSQNPGETASPASGALQQGSFPRSFVIPGTETSLRIGGSVTGVVEYGKR
jgi:hypothetical protein